MSRDFARLARSVVSSSTMMIAGSVVFMSAAGLQARSVQVSVTNLSPDQGTFLTPVFSTLHDGSVDLYNDGEAVSEGFERLAEDGTTQVLADEVTDSSPSAVVGATPGGLGSFPPPGVLGPGQTASLRLEADPDENRFFSYASMVIPSNDAFVSNDDPRAFEIFDEDGQAQSQSFIVDADAVLDAGTEVNNERNAAFLNQAVADAGTEEGDVVTEHPGFNGSLGNPDGTPQNILGGTNPNGISFGQTAADFTQPGRQIAQIDVTVVPSPAALSAGLFLLGGLCLRRPRKA